MPAVRRQSADPLERYYSRPKYVGPLATWLRMVASREVPSSARGVANARSALAPRARAVEPCVGHGHLILGAREHGLRVRNAPWVTVDADPRARAALVHGDWTAKPSTWTARWPRNTLRLYMRDASLVVTNPPFSIAIDVVEAAWRHCPGAVVAVLQRQSWYEPTRDREAFFREHPPDVITIGRCTFLGRLGRAIVGKDGKRWSGDSTSYAWFVWGADRQGLAGGLARIIPWRSDD